MAQMNRNVNLEEIDSDALFGIDALKNQSIFQNFIFCGAVIAGVMLNVLLPLFFETPRIVCVLLFMVLLMIGVAFGCNYTEDMTYGKYLYFFFFKPEKTLLYRSTEDVKEIRQKAMQIEKEEEMLLRMKQKADPKEQKKLLIKLIAFVVVLAMLIGAVFTIGAIKDKENTHHRVDAVTEVEDEY